MKAIRPLTDKQHETLDFLIAFHAKHGYPPTLRETGEATAISSTSAVTYNLNALEDHGLIERAGDTSRGIKLTVLPGPTDPEKLFKPLDIDTANELKLFIARQFPGVCPLIQYHNGGFAVLIVAR